MRGDICQLVQGVAESIGTEAVRPFRKVREVAMEVDKDSDEDHRQMLEFRVPCCIDLSNPILEMTAL